MTAEVFSHLMDAHRSIRSFTADPVDGALVDCVLAVAAGLSLR